MVAGIERTPKRKDAKRLDAGWLIVLIDGRMAVNER
jgi:hypothetical protein